MAIVVRKKLTSNLEEARIVSKLEIDSATDSIKITVNTTGKKINKVVATWKFSLEGDNKTLTFSMSQSSGAQTACILGCIGTTVGQALLECLLKSKNKVDIFKCLKEKAIGSLADAVVCLAGCLGVS